MTHDNLDVTLPVQGAAPWDATLNAAILAIQARVNENTDDIETGGAGDALVANPLSQFAATTSAQLAGVLSDETGTGAAVFANSPALVTPTGIVKGDVGLGNVDNTSDANKPVSTAQSAAINAKVADTITDAVTTIAPSQNAVFDALALKAPLASPVFTGTPVAPTATGGTDSTQVATTAFVKSAIDVVKAAPLSQFAATTSAQLRGVLSDETGTGAAVFANSPALVTPTGIVKDDVGLGNVDNTSDANKPVSTAQQTALDLKASQAALDLKAPLASPAFTGTPTGITKTHVGLANVDNTSDANKPVSTAQQTALDAKVAATIVDAKGDIIAATGADAVGRLAVGANGQVLKADSTQSTGLIWAAEAGGGSGIPASTVDAKGDLIAGTAVDTVARLPVGADGQVLKALASSATGLEWGTNSAVADAPYGKVFLDDFTGANDDAKLTAALAAVAADTYPRTIVFSNREYNFATAGRVVFDGLRMEGPPGYGNPERSSGTKMPAEVHFTFTGAWFTNPSGSDVYSVSFHNFSFTGGSNATFLGQTGSNTWYCLSLRDIFSSGLRTLLGTQATKLLITAASFTGDWEINNCYNGAIHIGGSDNVLWSDGMLLDSGTAFADAAGITGQYHLWCDSLDKTYIGPLYITAEGPWNGIRVTGVGYNVSTGTNQGVVWFHGLRLEGRNPGAGCNGSLFRIEGGQATIRDSWLAYGMVSPSTPGHSPQDAGIIHQTAGHLLVDGVTYDRATGVAETVPFIYNAAATAPCRVFNTKVAGRGGLWTGLPRVDQVGASGVTADNTVTVI